MFSFNASTELVDTLKDSTVGELYLCLRECQCSNNRAIYIEKILSSEPCDKLLKLLVECVEKADCGLNITEITVENEKLSREHRDSILEELKLQERDLSALALVTAATLTQLFVIDNFVGPSDEKTHETSYAQLTGVYSQLQKVVTSRSIAVGDAEIYHLLTNPWLIRGAQLCWALLQSLGLRQLLELEFLQWKHRFLTVYSLIILEPVEAITNELRKVQEYLFDHHIIKGLREDEAQLISYNPVDLCCELASTALLRDSTTSCRKFLAYASEVSGLSVEETGVLGKRTKFQQNNIPQLVVVVNKNGCSAAISNEALKYKDLPKDVQLDDDTLLPDISFAKDSEQDKKTSLEGKVLICDAQILLMNHLDLMLKSEVMEESLKDEWTLAYLRSLASSSSLWSVKYKSLALRSYVERKHMRRMDRALRQMEELIHSTQVTSSSSKYSRLESFYSVLPPPIWKLKKSMGDISFDLGLFKNALDQYSKIEYWEGIIKCYVGLGQTVKAEKIILQELAKQETPYLYCLLGDATENIEHYEKSWSLSKGRFARAKKSIGTHYYLRKDYEKAIENYELAHSANPSNVSILSLLAYSCLTIERYDRAAECYRNLTYHDDSNFLAWNNLSKAYIKLNQKDRAWRTLKEAIKCNYDEWKIWENFMLVSIEIGALEDVMTAWHRLIDLKSSHKDDQVLSALTYAILKQSIEKDSKNNLHLINEALKLIARLISTSDCAQRLWICYYRLLIREYQLVKDTLETKLDIDSRISKITNALQRATPSITLLEADWFNVPSKIEKVLDGIEELVDCYIVSLDVVGYRPEINRQWKYFKMTFSNIKKLLEKNGYNFLNDSSNN